MDRILTQDEIDELLSAFVGGEIGDRLNPGTTCKFSAVLPETRNIASIDLTKGQNYSKWRIANLDSVFNAFARYYGIGLSNSLQRNVNIQKTEIVSRFFEDFLSNLQNAGVLGVFSLDPLKGNGLFVFDKNLCFGLVEMLFGVSSESDFLVLHREVTPIESNVIRSLMSEGCHVLNRAFASLDYLHSSIIRVETNWKMLNILSPETEVIQVGFSVSVGELKGEILMIIPYFSLEPFRERFREEGLLMSETTNDSNWAKFLEKEVINMDISISAIWGELLLTVQEIIELSKGDIVTFDYDESAPIKVLAGQRQKYSAQPGLLNEKKAVRIVKQASIGE